MVEDEAQGAPAINLPDPLEVGEHLSVDLSGITDADGVSNIATSATYNWQRYEADGTTLDTDAIGTGASYALTAADQGHRIRVQVSFTDDDGNSEGPLSSTLTAAVAASTRQVKGDRTQAIAGQTLTADTSQITDADGLGTPTYSYQWQRDEHQHHQRHLQHPHADQAADVDQAHRHPRRPSPTPCQQRRNPHQQADLAGHRGHPQWRKLVGSLGPVHRRLRSIRRWPTE